jgi:hypothetical protein
MAMPVVVEWKSASGQVGRKTLPVEIWQNNISWKFRLDSKEEITSVVIDPDHVYPDFKPENNKWEASTK